MSDVKKEKGNGGQVLTPEFRVSFPAVFEARAAAEGQEKKFSVTMLFRVAETEASKKAGEKVVSIQPLVDAARAVIVEKFGPDKAKWPAGLRLPFRKGTEKDYDGYDEGIIFVRCSSKLRPGVVDQKVQPIIDPNEFYGGCYAYATVSPYWYDKAGNKGISFGLRNIQKSRDGEPFSGRNKPENDFDAIPVPSGAVAGKAGESAADLGIEGL